MRGAVSLIFHKFHIKPSHSGLWTVGSLLFSTLYHNREMLCVCFFFFLVFGGDSFIISLCWAFKQPNNERKDEKLQDKNKRGPES